MLNEKMKLAKNLFEKPDMVPCRDGYGYGLVELGEKDRNIVVLGADLTASVRADWFQKRFPDRFIEVGIAEQDMMCIAAGLSRIGKIPYVSTYSVFCTGRAWDQFRTTVCYANLNVKLGAAHAGISVGPDGATHQALEDMAIMRVIPNTTIMCPCDHIEAKKATLESASINGPVVIRFGREKIPVVTSADTPYKTGRAEVFRTGKDVTIVACGALVYEALVAAKKLESENIDAEVINCHTIKPLDAATIVATAKKTGAVVTAEEHQVTGGLGGAVAECLSKNCPVPMRFVGVQDTFGESGQPDELMKKYGLTSDAIMQAVRSVLPMKKSR
jgi:transketolase